MAATSNKSSEFAIELSGVTAKWTESDSDDTTLKNLSLRIRRGKLCAVIGPVGSGKVSHADFVNENDNP